MTVASVGGEQGEPAALPPHCRLRLRAWLLSSAFSAVLMGVAVISYLMIRKAPRE